MTVNWVTFVFGGLFATHFLVEFVLDMLQLKHLSRRRGTVPAHLKDKVDVETVNKAVDYNRDKLKLSVVSDIVGGVLTWFFIFVGFAAVDNWAASFELGPVITGLLFFALFGLISAVLGLPLELYSTFAVEQRHGFNRQTARSFAADKLKGLLIAAILGGVLGTVVLQIMQNAGEYWWLWAYLGVAGFQFVVMWLYPIVIMPLFNKFTPVSEQLAEDVSALAGGVGFPLAGVMTMDGSKRSAHSNAFIIGLKGARRIVLFDTLISKLERDELMGVLAHELGHFKLGHIKKRLFLSLVGLLVLFAALGWTRGQGDFYAGLGFDSVSLHGALVVFFLFVSVTMFPVGWLSRVLSRRDEFAADRFAVDAQQNGESLAEALVKLHKQNLSSPGSHKLYRAYHNSHPALKQRLRAIRDYAKTLDA